MPGKFKREAGGAQAQRGRGRVSLARRPREAWNIHLEEARQLGATLNPRQVPAKCSLPQLCFLLRATQLLGQADHPSWQGKVQPDIESLALWGQVTS